MNSVLMYMQDKDNINTYHVLRCHYTHAVQFKVTKGEMTTRLVFINN